MTRLAAIIVALAAMVMAGCAGREKNREVDRDLNAAESLMESQPDSALRMLQRIDTPATLSGERRARHALLLSQAYNKNYIDLTDDSLISIAVDYYAQTNNAHYKMSALYYRACILMNRKEYGEALSLAFEVEKLAEKLGDEQFLARAKLTVAQAYLHSFNLEGAETYFKQTLPIVKRLNNQTWLGVLYANLANLSLFSKDYPQALAYVDSINHYTPGQYKAYDYAMFANIGLENFEKADSIFDNYLAPNNPSVMARAYKLRSQSALGRGENHLDSLQSLLPMASRTDSVDIAGIAIHISFANGDFYNAWAYTTMVLHETSLVLSNMMNHSLYTIQLEREKQENLEKSNALHTRTLIAIFTAIIAGLLILAGLMAYLFIRNRHRQQISHFQNDLLTAQSELAEVKNELQSEAENRKNEQLNHASEINRLNSQISNERTAAQELLLAKYSWIEEFGNDLIDYKISNKSSSSVQNLLDKLETVNNKEFIPELIGLINKYRNNLIERISKACPALTDKERNILALYCVHFSPRIIGFILQLEPRTIYNTKTTIKRKIREANPNLLEEINDIFTTKV